MKGHPCLVPVSFYLKRKKRKKKKRRNKKRERKKKNKREKERGREKGGENGNLALLPRLECSLKMGIKNLFCCLFVSFFFSKNLFCANKCA